MQLSAMQLRVLGSLVEKQMTTPDYYPLSFNSLRTACNQTSNREPVMSLDDDDVERTVAELRELGLVKRVRIPGQRAEKVRHSLDDMLGVASSQLALLAVLMLRGAQTVGELRQRTERYHSFEGLAEVEDELTALERRDEPLAMRLERQPGQKEARYVHLLGSGEAESLPPVPASEPLPPRSEPDGSGLEDIVDRLAAELAEVRTEVERLRRIIES